MKRSPVRQVWDAVMAVLLDGETLLGLMGWFFIAAALIIAILSVIDYLFLGQAGLVAEWILFALTGE